MDDVISIIVPVYNVEKYLTKCVESIKSQTYNNIEIILIDDGSTDSSGQICDLCAKEDKRIIVIHKQNGGLSDARNAGLEKAIGNYVTFVDSDDFIDNDYVEFLYNALKKENAQMSVCCHKVILEEGRIMDKATHKTYVYTKKEALKHILYDEDFSISTWAKLYKKSLFDDVEFPKGRIFEDSATTYKLIDKCQKIVVSSESKYNYAIREGSITTNKFTVKKMDLIISTKEMCEYVEKKYPDLKAATDRRLIYAYLSTLTQLAKSDYVDAKIEKELFEYINKNSKSVLKNKETPMRDKIGIITAKFGPEFYKKIWRLYAKITGRG